MADIRQNSTSKDDFNRGAEDPLSNGGKWAQLDLAGNSLVGASVIGEPCARHRASQVGFSYWTPDPVMDDDSAECWARIRNLTPSGGATEVGFFSSVGGTNAADGYLFGIATASGTNSYRLRRYDNFVLTTLSSFSDVGADLGGFILCRRNGTSVEGWHNGSADLTTWTLAVSVVDATYTTGFYPTLKTNENFSSTSTGLDDFGSGPADEFIPQIYRRVCG